MNLCANLYKLDTKNLKMTHNCCRLYSKKGDQRYYYYNSFKNIKNGKKVTVIMINPSDANEHLESNTPDNTINNLYTILSKKTVPVKENSSEKYVPISSFEVINLFSEKDANPEDIIRKDNNDKLNETILKSVIEKANIIIPAWGIEEKFNKNIKKLIENIKIWCKDKDVMIVVNKYPCHFTTRCTSVNRNPEFIRYEFL